MRELVRTLPLMCGVLLIPIVPFLFFGQRIEHWLRGMAENPPADHYVMAWVVGLLSTDILLPIPSSVISTMSGWQLGWWRGTLATWVGMTIGAVLGFALARRWGSPLALWFSKAEDLDRVRLLGDRYGPLILVLTRGMPVLAEASVLMSGIHGLAWRKFLPAILLSNLGIAIAYSVFGDYAEQNQWLPLALGVAVAVPILIAAVGQRLLPNTESQDEPATSTTDT